MECPYCNADLIHHDSFGSRDYINGNDRNGKRGDIYKCPSGEGFNSEEECLEYLKSNNLSIVDYSDWTEVVCENQHGNSYYYTYANSDDLKEGYPC